MSRREPSLEGVHWVPRSEEPPFEPDAGASIRDEYDLAIVGAGYSGLSIAFNAALHGLSVLVLEAGKVGWGASGRNGGFVVPHFVGPLSADTAAGLVGETRGERLAQTVADGPDYVFGLIREHQIRCHAEQNGWIQPGHSQRSLAIVRANYEAWRKRGRDVEWLDAEELKVRTGASNYLGGWYGPTGGTVNPYALAQGLARVARARGVDIREGAEVFAMRGDDTARVLVTEDAEFRARQVVFATNGYTPGGVMEGLSRTVIPIRLYHYFTRPLTRDELAITLPQRIPITDIRKSGGFVRLDAENRVIAGGLVFGYGDNRPYGERHARLRLSQIFPHLRDVAFESYWEGSCSVSDDGLPVIQRAAGNVYTLAGFMTRGVAMSQTLGRDLGEFLAGKRSEADMPLPITELRPVPLQPLKTLIGRYAFPAFKLRDRLGLS
ncbi:NAD(P)/FAD-dependent oxidoreductase [Tepidamorphus sp. 3E244]|uniref:NAD(P)/FAD-dependent oxidoreductase n=1 Tax=Tepidamorphus sp. 3E244 TaxID=3385498 RepID=UPI0038FCCF4C